MADDIISENITPKSFNDLNIIITEMEFYEMMAKITECYAGGEPTSNSKS
jgi:hypothetical protein